MVISFCQNVLQVVKMVKNRNLVVPDNLCSDQFRPYCNHTKSAPNPKGALRARGLISGPRAGFNKRTHTLNPGQRFSCATHARSQPRTQIKRAPTGNLIRTSTGPKNCMLKCYLWIPPRDRLEQWCAFDLTDMGKGGCQGERKSGLRAFALGRSGLGLRQKSLKRLQSVREDLSALRALWLSPRRLRNSKNHAHRLNSFYTKQANTCTYSAAA